MSFRLTDLRWDAIVLQLALGAVGGTLAWYAGAPMPFLVGGLLAVAAASIRSDGHGVFAYRFPAPFRRYFTAIIGVMIGQSFTPGLIQGVSAYWVTLLGVAVFVIAAQGLGYLLFRRLGGYDPKTAFFAAMPGGLIEAVTFSEKFGADVQAITVQHFARVILVVVIVPFMFLIWTGVTVGSASGASMGDGHAHTVSDVLWTLVIAGGGIVLGQFMRLPASILIGPLLLSAVITGTGVLSVSEPLWMLYTAQLVVGVGLGSSFAGIERARLIRAFGLSLVSVIVFLCVGVVFALVLHRLTGLNLPALIVSFTPGGVTEMSLIALSLNLSPIIVATHHVFRILFTVFVASFVARRMDRWG
ncbi:MAG: AbrB family transcriptional regulator [Paracoccaceae bacterium]